MDIDRPAPADPDLPRLPLARYELYFRAQDTFVLKKNEDPRSLWHGVFGTALHAICCEFERQDDCTGCPLLHQCQYSYLFKAPPPPSAEMMRRYNHVPVPHVFQLGETPPRVIETEDGMSLSIILVGEVNKRLPLVIEALATAGISGVGAGRARLLLERVVQRIPGLTEPVLIGDLGQLSSAVPPEMPATPSVPTSVQVRLLSPYNPSGATVHRGTLDIGHFLMAVVRRISLLQYFYTGHRLEASFPDLKAATGRARISDSKLSHANSSRWAAGHGRRLDTGGLVGHFDLGTADIESLWPYLHLGQWLNVGKNASMGFGQYRLVY